MFLCEFAQHLLFMLRGTGVYFRGLVTFGEFEHYRRGKAECFYGKGLIDAYQREKKIKSVGLFIDSYCQQKNIVFDTAPLSDELKFVFITQNIGRLEKASVGGFPLEPILLETLDMYYLLYEIDWLKDVYRNATTHAVPDVKAKFQTAWGFYRQTYPRVTEALELNAFSPNFISPEHDWAYYKLEPEVLKFPKRARDSQLGFIITFQVLDKNASFREVDAEGILNTLAARKFTGSCECYESIARFGEPPDTTDLYRIAFCLRKQNGSELKSYDWWKSFEADVANLTREHTKAIELTELSELSEMAGIRTEPLSCGALFEEGEPEAITLRQDELEDTPLLKLISEKIY